MSKSSATEIKQNGDQNFNNSASTENVDDAGAKADDKETDAPEVKGDETAVETDLLVA